MNRGDYMYHRYIPNESGGFERVRVETPEEVQESPTEQITQSLSPLKSLLPKQTDTGDLLLILIFLLLMQEGGKEDAPTALLMLAAFIFG